MLGDQGLLFPLLYCVLAVVVMYIFTSGGVGVSADSERYLETADLIRNGEIGEAVRTAYPHSPMFYPLTIAVVQFVGLVHGSDAGRIVGILSFVISVVAVFFLGLRIEGKPTAHLSALSMLILTPILYTFSYCWSETLYIMLSLVFFLFMLSYLDGPRGKDIKYVAAGAVLAGLGFATRYLGVSLIGTGLVVMFFSSKFGKLRKRPGQMLLFGLLGVVPMVANLLTALIYVGSVERRTGPAPISFLKQVGLFLSTIYHDFLSLDLTFRGYTFLLTDSVSSWGLNSLSLWLGVIVILSLVGLTTVFVRLVVTQASFREAVKFLAVPAIYVVFYSLALLVTTSRISVDPLGSRFVTPLYPFVLLLVFSSATHLLRTLSGKGIKKLLSGFVIAGTSLFWVIQLISSASIYSGVSSGSFQAMEQPGNLNRSSLTFLKKRVTSEDTIITNIPRKLRFIWPRRMPYWSISGIDRSLDEIRRRCAQARVYLLLCTNDRGTDPLVLNIEKEGSRYKIPIHQLNPVEQSAVVEEKLRRQGLTFSKVVHGFDYIYQLTEIEKGGKP
ncbi:MAG: glycosyltransferase family 39 protein [Candidatus Zixiibacteriota bacterium]